MTSRDEVERGKGKMNPRLRRLFCNVHLCCVAGGTNSLCALEWALAANFKQILKTWLVRVILSGVNNKVICGALFETDE